MMMTTNGIDVKFAEKRGKENRSKTPQKKNERDKNRVKKGGEKTAALLKLLVKPHI